MTREEAQQLMEKRFTEYPALGAVSKSDSFQSSLAQILDFKGVNPELYALIENEVLVTLSLYAPLSKLGENIRETTELPVETANAVALLIETLIFEPVIDDLRAYDTLWEDELVKTSAMSGATIETKERLELRPRMGEVPNAGTPAPVTPPSDKTASKPLTREELMSALGAKRTMATDMEAARLKREANKNTPPTT
jgi:hypothetical protein